MSSEQVIDKAKKSYWRSVGWGAAFGLVGVIPSLINVSNTNKKIQEDYDSRAIKSGNLVCGATTEGIAFFSVPENLCNLSGWKISVILKDIREEENSVIEHGLSGSIIPPKKRHPKADEDKEEQY